MSSSSQQVCKCHIVPKSRYQSDTREIKLLTHCSMDMIEIPNLRENGPIKTATEERNSSCLGFYSALELIKSISCSVRWKDAETTTILVKFFHSICINILRSKHIKCWVMMERADGGFIIIDNVLVVFVRRAIAFGVESRCAGGMLRELGTGGVDSCQIDEMFEAPI
jgi:hypothetical protein